MRTTIAAVALSLASLTVLWVLTPPIAFNDGLGNDGKFYVAMTEALRGLPADPPEAPFAYRLLPSALVALMPFEPRTGFLLVNIVSVIGSAVLLVRLLRRYGINGRFALLGVLSWLALPMGARWDLYYPTLTDAVGFFLLMALIVCALEERYILFAVALVAAVLTRENLIIAIPFFWRAHLRAGPAKITALVALASLPAMIVFFLVRAFPPLAPPADSANWLEAHHIWWNLALIANNGEGHTWRYLLAAPISLGLLLWIPILRPHASASFLRREMHWTYFALLAFLFAAIGGFDGDRYLYVLSPLLLILAFGVNRALWSSGVRVIVLTGLHFVALRVGWPIGSTEHDYLQYSIGYMDLERLGELAILTIVVFAIATVAPVLPSRAKALPSKATSS